MPQIEAEVVPKGVETFLFHGVDVDYGTNTDQAIATCPFCDKRKMYINMDNGCWDCKSCGAGAKGSGHGNPVGFLKLLHESLNGEGLEALAKERKFLSTVTMESWGVGFSNFNHKWYVPGYNAQGSLCQLYKLTQTPTSNRLFPTKNLGHQLHGMNLWDDKKSTVYICEGCWDGIALHEILGETKLSDSGLMATANYNKSLLKDANVIAVPGVNVFNESWCKLLKGKNVVLMYDNDYPKKHPKTGTDIGLQGFKGMQRVAKYLTETTDTPLSISFLAWGDAAGYTQEYPDGCDVRDVLAIGKDVKARVKQLAHLLNRIKAVPTDWLTAAGKSKRKSSAGDTLELKECTDRKTLTNAWKKAMKWTPGLQGALDTMLASIISTNSVGDQLWIKIISPASSGKSVLCEALSVNMDHILAKSTIRGMHSGFQTEDRSEDHSLIAEVKGKTLVIKDGDTLLQSPNLAQVLSEMRDVYDRNTRSSYRNTASRAYTGINMTVILCGTNSLRSLDASELGERFLNYSIMDEIDEDLEEDILWRVANTADRNLLIESDGNPEHQQSPEMTEAMQLTGGYINYLKGSALQLLGEVIVTEEVKRQCMMFGKFVAYMRARPSSKQDESAEREFAARLVSQHIRLTRCLGAVMNRQEADDEVMNLVRKVALDTAKGKTLDIVNAIAKFPKRGMESTAVAHAVGRTTVETRSLMRFLTRIGALESVTGRSRGLSSGVRWRLSERMLPVFNSIYVPEPKE